MNKLHRCPTCARRFAYASIAAHPTFPFCSERCQQAELNAWYTERYVMARPLDPELDGDGLSFDALEDLERDAFDDAALDSDDAGQDAPGARF